MIETESINRYFIIEQSEYDFAQISLSLWGFCSWNPESPEFDHVSISVIDQTNTNLNLWNGAFYYQEASKDCQGYTSDLDNVYYNDWGRYSSQYSLNQSWIECLSSINNLICSHDNRVQFFNNKIDHSVLVGLFGQFNQQIENEAWGFSSFIIQHASCEMNDESIYSYKDVNDWNHYVNFATYVNCVDFAALTIGQSVIASNFEYLAIYQNDSNLVFYQLYPYYYPIYYDSFNHFNSTFSLDQILLCVTDFGQLSVVEVENDIEIELWHAESACENETNVYYHSMTNGDSLLDDGYSLYDISCNYYLTIIQNDTMIAMVISNRSVHNIWEYIFAIDSRIESTLLTNDRVSELRITHNGAMEIVFNDTVLFTLNQQHSCSKKRYNIAISPYYQRCIVIV